MTLLLKTGGGGAASGGLGVIFEACNPKHELSMNKPSLEARSRHRSCGELRRGSGSAHAAAATANGRNVKNRQAAPPR